jgi:hypothetical protein
MRLNRWKIVEYTVVLLLLIGSGAAQSCSTSFISVAPPSFEFPNSGGQGFVTVSAQAGCPWSATTNSPLIQILSGSGVGIGNITFLANANPSSQAQGAQISVFGGLTAANVFVTVDGTTPPPSNANTMHVFHLGSELHIHELLWSGGKWFPNDLTALWGGANATAGTHLTSFDFTPPGGSNGMHIFYLASDQHVHELVWSNNAWFPNDINALAANAPLVDPSAGLVGYTFVPPGGSNGMHVFYIGTDHHIHELFWIGGTWIHTDLTTQWGGVAAAPGSNLAGTTFVPPGGSNSMHVFYLGTDQHIHELNWTNNTWIPNDLTAQWGGAIAASGSSLLSYTFLPSNGSNTMHVFYVGTNQHIEALDWVNYVWTPNDLTAEWGGATAAAGSPLTGYTFVPPGSTNGMHVFYLSSDGHVHELFGPNGTWFPSDLTASWGGPAATSGSGLTGFTFTNSAMHVFYVAADQHVHELIWQPGSWVPDDITAFAGAPLVNTNSALSGLTF